MNFLYKTNLRSGGFKLINLLHVSSFSLKKNIITLQYTNLKNGIGGNFLLFGGGGNKEENLTFESEKDASDELKKIEYTLNTYYSKGMSEVSKGNEK